jgi:AraC family transcriptional regulator of adaptative response / DNA-3-methyladenine glycosylase II
VRLGPHAGWLAVRHAAERRALRVELAPALTPVLPALLGRLRHLFDLSARPDVIAAHLGRDPLLSDAVARAPGLRVPGAFDGFELALRAILGQQISVKAATTLAGRLVGAFGEPARTPYTEVSRHAPTAERLAGVTAAELTALGVTGARARSMLALAEAVATGHLRLEAGAPPEATMATLVALPGVGPWTAHYVALRALRWPDAFPKEDVVLRRRLGGVTAAQAEARSQAWRPWRSYATLHLWRMIDAPADQPRPASLACREPAGRKTALSK